MVRKNKKLVLSQKQYMNKIASLVKRHGKVRVVCTEGEIEEPCECNCKKCVQEFNDNVGIPNRRRRLINRKGDCTVSFKGNEYRKWSRFETCCFMEPYDLYCATCESWNKHYCECKKPNKPKKQLKKSILAMVEHDEYNNIYPERIEYGLGFKKSIEIRLKW